MGFFEASVKKNCLIRGSCKHGCLGPWYKKQNIPLYKSFGFENTTLPKTSYTISIGELDELDSKLEESKKCSILKLS